MLLECKTFEGYDELTVLLDIAFDTRDKNEFYQWRSDFAQMKNEI